MNIPPPSAHDRALFEAEAGADRASDRVAAEVRGLLDNMEAELERLLSKLEDGNE